ncbi:MAG: DHH family phosphoesterase [Clostridia bacterium]|nr:DHH family phosphoesterase [Clostridia bacterium]
MPNNLNGNKFDRIISKTKIYLVIIAILLIALCVYEIRFIMPAIIIYALVLMYTFWTNNKRRAELSEHIRELTLNVDNAAKSTLINSPFPLVIVETDGNIIWKSSKFIQEFANVDINTYLNEIVREIRLELENGSDDVKKELEELICKHIEIGDKKYKIYGEYVKSKSKDKKDKKKEAEYMTTLYFIDETENIEIENKYESSKLCVGIAMVDNYDEIIQRVADEDKPAVIAQLEKAIYDWASEIKGLIIKSDRDTFVLIAEKQYIDVLEEEKFKILDQIKEIDIPGQLQSTLSIAVATEGDSNYEKYKTAQAMIDIALGRGGDQAIVKKDGKYTFFGGRTQEVEKRTKVKARTVAHALEELMREAEKVIIMGHTNSDIDAMGSGLGIYRLAKVNGKEAYVVNESANAGLEKFIELAKEDEEYSETIIGKDRALELITPETLLVITDTHKTNYVDVPELLDKTNKIVIIDHHRRSTDFIENAILTFHEVYASSACELVTELIEYSENEVELTQLETESLYAGIMMDTKNFTFKTGVRTFEAAAYLRKCGVDIIKVKKWFQSDLETYNKISQIVSDAEITNDTIAISIYDKEDENANVVCAKAADELLTISDITASFVLGRLGDKICISGRSIGDINVQIILEKLGGGGHITLAGAQVEGMTMDEVRTELIIRINEYFAEISN